MLVKNFKAKMLFSMRRQMKKLMKINNLGIKINADNAKKRQLELGVQEINKLVKKLIFDEFTIAFYYIRDHSNIITKTDQNIFQAEYNRKDIVIDQYDRRDTVIDKYNKKPDCGMLNYDDSYLENEMKYAGFAGGQKSDMNQEQFGFDSQISPDYHQKKLNLDNINDICKNINNNFQKKPELDNIDDLCQNINKNLHNDLLNNDKMMDFFDNDHNLNIDCSGVVAEEKRGNLYHSDDKFMERSIQNSNHQQQKEEEQQNDQKSQISYSNLSNFYLVNQESNITEINKENQQINISDDFRKAKPMDKLDLNDDQGMFDVVNMRKKKRIIKSVEPKFYGHWHCLMFQNFNQIRNVRSTKAMAEEFDKKVKIAKSLYAWIDHHNLNAY